MTLLKYENTMGHQSRKKILEKIEKKRNSKVIVYFVGDRPVIQAQISSDSIRSLTDHLRDLNNGKPVEKIDFYLYSIGGTVVTPWPIISTLREYCKTLNVLIPYKAFSATTLMALGADKILMGKSSHLGPIDPQLNLQPNGGSVQQQVPISTEDITSYISFIKEKVGIEDQNALADLTKSLAETMTPTMLGQINRIHSHIRLVAKKMLKLVAPKIEDEKIDEIIEVITEKMFIHGHAVNRQEAKEIGLHVEDMDDELEELCWNLFLDYEKEMKLRSPASSLAYFDDDNQDEYREKGAIIACIESANKMHKFSGPLLLKRIRNVPPQLNLNLTIPIQLPPGINFENLEPQVQQHTQQQLQAIQNNLARMINDQINNQLKNLMPTVAINTHVDKMTWKQII